MFKGKKTYQFSPESSVSVTVAPARPGAEPSSYALPDTSYGVDAPPAPGPQFPAHGGLMIENHGPGMVHICEPSLGRLLNIFEGDAALMMPGDGALGDRIGAMTSLVIAGVGARVTLSRGGVTEQRVFAAR